MRPLGLGLALLLVLGGAALAQSSLGIGAAEVPAPNPGGPFADVFVQINTWQRQFFASLRGALVAIRGGEGALSFLVLLSLGYGVFHAAGPGHGKAVVSSYLLANEVELRRGVIVAFASALLQAVSAFALVGAAYLVLRGTSVTLTGATVALEIASYALVALFGAWLLARKLAPVFGRLRRRATAPALAGLAFAAPGGDAPRAPIMRPASRGLAPGVCEGDEDDCDCGRAHMPDPRALRGGTFTAGAAASAVLAVGLRPCSGAIVVLTFSLVNGLWLAGALSVLAMALGTAVTVSLIAALAVFAKGAAIRVGRGGAGRLLVALEIGGALLLLLLGLALLGAALQGL